MPSYFQNMHNFIRIQCTVQQLNVEGRKCISKLLAATLECARPKGCSLKSESDKVHHPYVVQHWDRKTD